MIYGALQRRLPRFLRRHVLHFETAIEDAVALFATGLEHGARVLDAGAGEGTYRDYFRNQRYCGVDLAIGNLSWSYRGLDAIADLHALPFPAGCFDASISLVTLEHVREPGCVLDELARVTRRGGLLLLAVPHQWEVHQAPHDYYRFTLHGLAYLLQKAGFAEFDIRPVGGLFRLLSRRLLNALQFFPGIWFLPAALLLAPPALLLPLFDRLDRNRDFTPGYICTARRAF